MHDMSQATWGDTFTTMPSCATNQPGLAMAFGAGLALTRLDRAFPFAGPGVHYALGGVAADYYCRNTLGMDGQMMKSAGYGILGGMIAGTFLPAVLG